MASNIDVSLIDATYPIAGQDNNVVGFHDNYSAIKANLTLAKNEISQLQTQTTDLFTSGDINKGAALVGFAPTNTISSVNVQSAISEVDGKIVVSQNATLALQQFNADLASTGDTSKGAGLIGFTPSGTLTSTTVQSALTELASDTQTSLNGLIQFNTDLTTVSNLSKGAALVGFAPSGILTSVSVQGAVTELAGTVSSHTSSINSLTQFNNNLSVSNNSSLGAALVGFTPTGSIASTNVQAALTEVVSDLSATSGAGLIGFDSNLSYDTNTVGAAFAKYATLQALASSTSNTAGSGIVGYSDLVTYASGTVGSAISARVLATDLSNTTIPAKGAGMVGYGTGSTVRDALDARIPEIADYATLRAYTGPVTTVYVLGVTNIFDGGCGMFRVDPSDTTSGDNGGTVLVDAAGRRWKREFSGAVNVLWFGADKSGSSDSAPAFQAAGSIESANIAVYAPAGSYSLGATVTFSGLGKRLYGDGVRATTLTATHANDVIVFSESSYCEISFLKVVGNGSAQRGVSFPQRTGMGVTLQNRISDIQVENVGTGIYLQNPVHCSVEKVRTLDNCSEYGLHSEFISDVGAGQGGTNLNLISCWFQAAATGIACRVHANWQPVILGCQFERARTGLVLRSVPGATIVSPQFEDNGQHLSLEICNYVNILSPKFDSATTPDLGIATQSIVNIDGGSNIFIGNLSSINDSAAYIDFLIRYMNATSGSYPADVKIENYSSQAGKGFSGEANVTRLQRFVNGTLYMLGQTIQQMRIQLAVSTAAPASPAVGELAIADGATWNPVGGRALVIYSGAGVWDSVAAF